MEEDVEAIVRERLSEHSAIPELTDIIKDGVRLQPIGGGYLNHVYRALSSDESKSCVIKVYGSCARAFGKDSPLEPERSCRESDALEFLKTTIPSCCPSLVLHEEANHIVCLEDFRDFTPWRSFLLSSCDLKAGAKLADMLVKLHSSTHRLKVGEDEFDTLKQRFGALPQLSAFLWDSYYHKPFLEGRQYKEVCRDDVRDKLVEIKADPAVLKALTLAKEWLAVGSGDCVIHGDLHADSFMVKGEDIKLVDVECVRVGPPAVDVALLVCNYVLLYHYHQHRAQNEASDEVDDGINHSYVRRHILDLICITLSRYMDGMGRVLGESFDHHQVWKQVLLFLGVEIIAWVSGPPSFAELDPLPEAQLNCLNTALSILHKQSLSLGSKDLSKLIHS